MVTGGGGVATTGVVTMAFAVSGTTELAGVMVVVPGAEVVFSSSADWQATNIVAVSIDVKIIFLIKAMVCNCIFSLNKSES
jgi:hypothetical protein